MNYSYFILKPDGVRFLDEICKSIEKDVNFVKYYAIDDFDSIIKKIYHTHYEKKGDKFKKDFESFLFGLKQIFGNRGLLILIGDNKGSYEELLQNINKKKAEIRKKFINDNIGIITNYGEGNQLIRFISVTGEPMLPRIMKGSGNYRISNFNIIHSPDSSLKTNFDELKILIDEGIIDDKNLITDEMLKNMRKYGTLSFQKDMKEKDYVGNIQPDISGWIADKIKEEDIEK